MSAEPRYATERDPSRETLGPVMAKLASALGKPLMPWQRQVVDVAGEIDPRTGRMAYDRVLVSVQRQAGKTTLVRTVALWAAMQEAGRAWYTAQTRNDARDAWIDATEAVTRSALADAVHVRLTNGSESLQVPATGGTFRVFAPSPEALHGRQADRIFYDECWAHDLSRGRELEAGGIATTATRAMPQTWFLSTAGTDRSTWLKDLINQGRSGAKGMAYFDWGISETDDPSDLDAVCAAHPAVGHTIRREAVEAAYAALPEGEFARAYGNRWTSALERVIDPVKWDGLLTTGKISPSSAVAFGADIAPDRSCGSIVVAGRGSEDIPVLEVIDHREGAAWVAGRLRELVERWAPIALCLDPVGPTSTVVDELVTSGVKVQTTNSREIATACLRLYDAIHDRDGAAVAVRPHPALAAAVGAAGRRYLGGGWAWDRSGSVPISPLMAATLAWWAWDHPPVVAPPAPDPAIY